MRIRRSEVELHREVQSLLERGPFFKTKREICGFTVHQSVGRWEPVSDNDRLQHRMIELWMTDGRKIGVARIELIRSDGSLHDDAIFMLLDTHSQTFLEIAEVLSNLDLDEWEGREIYGQDGETNYEIGTFFAESTVVHYDLVWTEPGFPSAAWAEVLRVVTDRHCRQMPCTAIVLKAFPLEYNNQTPNPRRWAAMKRHYGRLFAVAPAPKPWGDDGWMLQLFV